MRVQTTSGSVYEVHDFGGGLIAKRIGVGERFEEIPEINQFSKLRSDKIMVGQRMYFENGIVTTEVAGIL